MDDDTCFGLMLLGWELSEIGNQEYSSVLAKNSPLVEVRDSFLIALLFVLCCSIHAHGPWQVGSLVSHMEHAICAVIFSGQE